MGAKPTTTSFTGRILSTPGPQADIASSPRTRRWHRLAPFLLLALPLSAVGMYYAHIQYRAARLASEVRELTSAGKPDEAGRVLHEWLQVQPLSLIHI